MILPDGCQCGIQCVGGRGPEILMYSSLQIGRSYRESADPPMPLLADLMCSGRPLPHTESQSGMGKIHRKAQNFTCRVHACIL